MIFVDFNVPMYLVGAPHRNRDRIEEYLPDLMPGRTPTSAEVYQEMGVHRYVAIDRREAIDDASSGTLLPLRRTCSVAPRSTGVDRPPLRCDRLAVAHPGWTAVPRSNRSTIRRTASPLTVYSMRIQRADRVSPSPAASGPERIGAKDIRSRCPIGCRPRKTGMSQPAFARSIGIPLGTLKNWEQGRHGPARVALIDTPTIVGRAGSLTHYFNVSAHPPTSASWITTCSFMSSPQSS